MNTAMIFLQAIGPVDAQVMAFLKENLSSSWSVEILPEASIPKEAYHKARRQYEGAALLRALSDRETPVLGVTEVDTFVDGLNYIFGLAAGRKAMISLKRLRQEFYGLAEDDELLKQRAQKEAMHELGHVLGLNHCPDQNCVMYFSNSILDTDFKDWRYCGRCEWKVMRQ
jgi:archaemetzincin